ncbi:hypothetical protein BDV33DRAFT_231974 [Aspergillus novoparasiticus]|uniref:Phytanoyl-CoA dioxygenase family protein n=1 Tax=Aspergillus novoparasiticus TaxID=986946 RepID=A0A5N6EP98_9EURO|nr:hypothetical protein BDV33DRAFT_231974 [Aspergillus novoparasiticus]
MGSVNRTSAEQEIPISDYDLNYEAYGSEDALVEDIIRGLKIAGGCIIRNAFKQDTITSITEEIRPFMANTDAVDGDFWPKETRTLNGLVSKSETFTLKVVGSSMWHKVSDYFLTSTLRGHWNGQDQLTSVSKPQLNNTIAFRIGPGARDQAFHRDDIVHHTWNGAVDKYELGRDNGFTMFVACSPTTKANGATRFIPGSHLWDYSSPPPTDNSTAVYVEMKPGDCFMMLSSVYHGGSANTTTDDYRLIVATVSTRGYLRQEENQYLAHPPEKIKQLPMWLQKFVGYTISHPFAGYVDLGDPLIVLNPEAGDFVQAGY